VWVAFLSYLHALHAEAIHSNQRKEFALKSVNCFTT
jgi:hypothetical protein